ncbi:MAG: hypothetical protein V5A20_04230 [Salinibacter sp.]|uniref:hypothetical protein n=1 Tax=Salinibacter sp. TaxID=2065818 RepID=UPI002FC29173
MPSVCERSHFYSMDVDPDINAVRFRWDGQPTGEELRYGANQLLEFVRSRAVSGLIVDTRRVTAHPRSSVEWLVRAWMPKVATAGIRHVAVVHEDNLLARTEMEALKQRIQQASSLPLFYTAESQEEARRWTAEQNQSITSFSHLVRYLSSLTLFSLS